MDLLTRIYSDLVTSGILPVPFTLSLLGCLALFFLIQLYYYLGAYGALPKFRNNRGIRHEISTPPISVVVVARENTFYFVENTLPLLLSQNYPLYEVVVVDCSYDEEIGAMLQKLSARHAHLKITRFMAQHNVNHSTKLALTVGIKAARYEHLLFTSADSYPTSDKWVSLMAKGFIGGDVVIGYCGIERKKGLTNQLIRSARLASSIRYLAQATRGGTYRGITHNLGYTKSLYFAHKGFCHLNLSIGEDDLFIQRISNPKNVSVVMNPHATVRQLQYGGLGWWNGLQRFYSYTFRYYPLRVRLSIGIELWSRFLFFASAVGTAALLPFYGILISASLVLLRLGVVELKVWRIGKRLGERGLLGGYILYDLISPLSECILALRRRIRPNKAIWR